MNFTIVVTYRIFPKFLQRPLLSTTLSHQLHEDTIQATVRPSEPTMKLCTFIEQTHSAET